MNASGRKLPIMKRFTVSIPLPCHENWDNMTPQEKGRFCAACQKTVVDFTNMSDRQIAGFFKKTNNVCGRFDSTQLQREMVTPPKRLPWIRHFFQLMLPAFLLSQKASAQHDVKGKVAVCVRPVQGDTIVLPLTKPAERKMLKGQVISETGEPIAGAVVRLSETDIATQADNEGFFNLSYGQIKQLTIVTSSVGYESKTVTVNLKDTALAQIALRPGATLGLVAVSYMTKKKKKPAVPWLQPKRAETVFSKFAVFPNPATSNSRITIEAKKIEDGSYQLTVVNGPGATVQVNEVVFSKDIKRVAIDLKELAAGQYFIQLTNRKSGKVYVEAILIN